MKHLLTLVATVVLAQEALAEDKATSLPAELSQADIAGAIFERPDMTRTQHEDGHVTLDGVDEFMYFLEGSVTLTSSDGSVQTIDAGEGVTIAKEWTGIWETDGYTKIWVIYSALGE